MAEKFKVLFLGIENPRPKNVITPSQKYETIYLNDNRRIECWEINAEKSNGQVAIFHGYAGNKSSMIEIAHEFFNLGFSVLLVDFTGSGGSDGNQTTVGYFESVDVKACYEYLKQKNSLKKIYLYGTSMGSVAILKAVMDYKIEPSGIIAECPYGSMYQAVSNRFKNMGLPSFPFALLLVFWGSIQNGFWGFSHDVVKYARSVTMPTLILRGKKDINVTEKEINDIYNNLGGRKVLKEYDSAGHVDIYSSNREAWKKDVAMFLEV